MFTPITVGLTLVIVLVFFILFYRAFKMKCKTDDWKLILGVAILLIFADAIWAVFYYFS